MKRILLFPNTRSVMRGEKILLENDFVVRVIPVPREYTSDCGMALELDADQIAPALVLLHGDGLSVDAPPPPVRLTRFSAAGGCSAKLDSVRLEQTLNGVFGPAHPQLIVSAETHDDAGVYRLPGAGGLIQTVDFFPPVVDDPWDFGRIAATNALSDVYAMGGRPLTVLNLVVFPAEGLDLGVLRDILAGGTDAVREAGAAVAGGHTIQGDVPIFGCAVTGQVAEEELVTNAGARPGDQLFLTKPLGTGILLAAHRLGLIDENALAPALRSMKRLNARPVEAFAACGVRGATDVTGFGLFGHAFRFATASGVTFRLRAEHFPTFPGVRELLAQGCIPGAAMRNRQLVESQLRFQGDEARTSQWLGLDAQTSGGLLVAVPAMRAARFRATLEDAGELAAAEIGVVEAAGDSALIVE